MPCHICRGLFLCTVQYRYCTYSISSGTQNSCNFNCTNFSTVNLAIHSTARWLDSENTRSKCVENSARVYFGNQLIRYTVFGAVCTVPPSSPLANTQKKLWVKVTTLCTLQHNTNTISGWCLKRSLLVHSAIHTCEITKFYYGSW